MVKVFRGFRFNIETYNAFCTVAEKEKTTATGALEHFMADCVALDRLVFADQHLLDAEAEARVLVNWLNKGKYHYQNEKGTEIQISGRLLSLLPKVTDAALKHAIEEALKNSVKNNK